jgi:hypothetical protein
MISPDKIIGPAKPIHTENVSMGDFIKFKNKFNNWIHSSVQPVIGLPKKYYIVSGLTDAFNQTYALYNKIGIFEGEYGYHLLSMKDRVTTDLSQADVIIISHPFSGDGMSSHDKIKIADTYNKPIFIDCAFFGICRNINFDFTPYKNIHSVGFSLSKTFGSGLHRVGLLYTIDLYPVTVYEQSMYPFVAGAEHHYKLIDTMSPDAMVKKYGEIQKIICKELNFTPSDTILFGLDNSVEYSKYKRGDTNRLCISNLIASYKDV